MEYEETYRGQRIIVTTLLETGGGWTARAELLDSGRKTLIAETTSQPFQSEEEARRETLSKAVAAIDRARISKGKP